MGSPTRGTWFSSSATEEHDHAGPIERDAHGPEASALEQGQGDWSKAAATAQTRLVDPDETPDRRPCRDLAMFNLAIDSKLRGCDVVAIKVEDVASSGYTADRATIRQKKTGRPVRFELSDRPAKRSMIT